MDRALFLLTFLLAAIVANGHMGHDHAKPEEKGFWAQKTEIKKSTGVDVKWNHTDPDYMTMEVSAKTNGIVGIGFCPVWKGTMEGCDIVIGWVDETGKGQLYVSKLSYS
jgi:hypothetical protein